MIYDEAHALAGISHGGSWALVKTDALEVPSDTVEERSYARAWKTFYDAIAVKERGNPGLRRQLMPKRFWGDMTEMEKEAPRKSASTGDSSIRAGRPAAAGELPISD